MPTEFRCHTEFIWYIAILNEIRVYDLFDHLMISGFYYNTDCATYLGVL